MSGISSKELLHYCVGVLRRWCVSNMSGPREAVVGVRDRFDIADWQSVLFTKSRRYGPTGAGERQSPSGPLRKELIVGAPVTVRGGDRVGQV